MMTDQPNFSVPEEVSSRLRQIGHSIAAATEEDDLSSTSRIVAKFLHSISGGERIFFINLNEKREYWITRCLRR